MSRPAIAVRDATLEDLPRIVAIYNETVPGRRVTADLEPVTVGERRAWFERHAPDRRPLWVAEVEGGVVGWLSLESFYGRPAYDATVEVSVYVDAAIQRLGIGSLMLAHAIARAPDLRIRTLLGFVFSHNLPSIAFFGKAGFATWGHYPDVAELDGVLRSLTVLGRKV